MKYCPSCQIKYADETLQFCLQDGTGLLDYSEQSAAPTRHWSEKETVVRQAPVTAGWESNRKTQDSAVQTEAKKSGTFLTIVVTALVMLVIFGGIAIGWLLLRDKGAENNVSSNLKTPEKTSSPTPTPTKTAERNKSENSDGSSDWEIDNNLSFNGGERITFYAVPNVEQCQKDCAGNSRCTAYTLIRAGFYNPQDPPMCYLMAKVTDPSSSPCCISGVKKGSR